VDTHVTCLANQTSRFIGKSYPKYSERESEPSLGILSGQNFRQKCQISQRKRRWDLIQ